NPREVMSWALRYVGADAGLLARAGRVMDFVVNGRDFFREGFQSAGEVSRRIAQRLDMSAEVQNALPSLFEQWNGNGMPLGLRGPAIRLIARIVYATTYLESAHRLGGRQAAQQMAAARRGRAFDPTVADAFLAATDSSAFWDGLEQEQIRETVLAMEPAS